MQFESFVTNDGARIAYQTSIPLKSVTTATADIRSTGSGNQSLQTCILLMHGFSGSSDYFHRNFSALSKHHWTLAPDMRGHGRSQHTPHGYHVARLAMDLRDLITKVICGPNSTVRIYAVGCSIGAAVLWTYTELFTDHDFAGLVFVDQAPLQDRSLFGGWDEQLAHYGCYDEATMLEAQRCWASGDPQVVEATHVGLVASCLGYRYAPSSQDAISPNQQKDDQEFFVKISRSCDGVWLAKLLADHTRYDHREAAELIEKPVLVMAGRRSGCFTVEGMMETARRAEMNPARRKDSVGRAVFDSGHWLFWEEPDRFHQELLKFVDASEAQFS